MKKHFLLFFITFLAINCDAQIIFEKGYYINNSDEKIDCLIKNYDWQNNPTEFKYKLSENSKDEKGTLETVKEFGVYNKSKYLRSKVKIDRSSEMIEDLDIAANPIFNEEELFLKVLVEGKSDLYEYIDGNLTRYFYGKSNTSIEQLIFKKYLTYDKKNSPRVGYNKGYIMQLRTNLICSSFQVGKVSNLNYKRKDLIKHFTQYSNCHDHEITFLHKKKKRNLFDLNLRPHLSNSSLTILKVGLANNDYLNFDNQIRFGFGLELESFLPFNRNKWSILIEPTYQYYKAEKSIDANYVAGGKLHSSTSFNSIEIPTGLRYYFLLNKKSKFFANISYVFDFSSKPEVDISRDDGSDFDNLVIKSKNNMAFGIGYKLNNRFSLEIRYLTTKESPKRGTYWRSEYNTSSIIFGYTLF